MKRSTRYGFLLALRKARRTGVRAGREEGESLLEFALLLPLLSMLLVGIIYGGMTFYHYVELTNAVAVGARTLATNRAALAGPPTACTLAENAVTSAAASLPSPVVVATPTFAGSSTCSALQLGDAGTVSATYPCRFTIPFLGINLCPMKGTGTGTACPYSYCISSTTTVYIQ